VPLAITGGVAVVVYVQSMKSARAGMGAAASRKSSVVGRRADRRVMCRSPFR
jgi:hypothetical protein